MIIRRLRSLLVLLLLTVGTTACGSTTSPTAPSPQERRIVVLGDSLAVSPSRSESFPAHLQTMIGREGLPWTVTNAGISGDTTAGGVSRVADLLVPDVGILVLALGANDGLGGVPVPTIEQNLSAIVETAQARGVQVLLCGMETLPTRGLDYAVAFHRVFPAVAERYRIPLVPFLLAGVALIPEMNGPDGIHPNAAGARRIAENVWPYLEPMLRTSTARAPLATAGASPDAQAAITTV